MNFIRPIITEKSMTQAQKGWYSFAVSRLIRKESIAREVARLYNVTVRDVRTIHKTGKVRRSGRKMLATRHADWKKALVKLAKGQRIPVFEVTETPAKS